MKEILSLDFTRAMTFTDEDMILCPCEVFGVPHHAQFLKVERDADGIWQPTNDPHGRFSDYVSLNDGDLLTVKLHGHPGDWLCAIYPYAD